MYKPVHAVEVQVWGKTVGAVALDPKLGYYAFEYDPAFTRSGIELAPITMPLAAAREPFVFPALPALTYRHLPAMLADALPDDFGNNLIDAWMAREGVSKAQITSLVKVLRSLGRADWLSALAPAVSISPLQALKARPVRQRVSRK